MGRLHCQSRPRLPGTQRAARGGWSLIEITLVLVIAGVVTSIAVPRYARSISIYRADVGARRVVADLALARAEARATGVAKTIVFGTPARGYTLQGVVDRDRPGNDYAADFTDEPYVCRLTPALTLTADGAATTSVTFDRYGTPNAGGTVVVYSTEGRKTVTLDRLTGRATIE